MIAASPSLAGRPAIAAALALALALAPAIAGCGEPEITSPAGRVGASIAVLRAAPGEVAVVNPDHGSVSFLDAATLEPRAVVDVGEEPRALIELASGELLVTTHRGGEAVWIDVAGRAVVDRRPVCAGPWGVAEDAAGDAIAIACEWEGAVVRVDPGSRDVKVIAGGLSRPRAVAWSGAEVIAAGFTGGLVHRIDPGGAVTSVSLVPETAAYRPALAAMTANLAAAVLPVFDRVFVAHQLVNHDGSTGIEQVADDYGSVVDGNPKINPAVTALGAAVDRRAGAGDPPVLYARFDGGPRVFNGPEALAAFGDRHLLVANLSTGDVAVLDAAATDPDRRAVASFAVGTGPSGIAVDEAGSAAFVDNALDGSVSRIDLTSPFGPEAPRHAAEITLVRDLPPAYSAAALAGRRLFHDASNPHVTPAGVVACSTCHPGGGDDGLVWFIHTTEIPLKRRRTPHLAGARTGTAPFHWDGELPSMAALGSATITDLMAGDGLLVDVDVIQAFVDEIVKPPIAKVPDGAAGAIDRGRAVFTSEAAGCASCHGGPDLTDNGFHAVLDPMSLYPDETLAAANTPALHGLFLRAPYFHDGRSPDLRDLLTRADAAGHGSTAQLTDAEISDLVAYLSSL